MCIRDRDNDDLNGKEKWEIIYYYDEEDKQTYCFPIETLLEQFEKDDFINHKSNRRFDENFSKTIIKKYQKPPKEAQDIQLSENERRKLALAKEEEKLINLFKQYETEQILNEKVKEKYIKAFQGLYVV
jgi:hypothetical protein